MIICLSGTLAGVIKMQRFAQLLIAFDGIFAKHSIVPISDITSGGNMSDKKAVIKNADMSEEMQQV